jgi:pyruvate-ferredoxin/flavodoxin oxidoreductase
MRRFASLTGRKYRLFEYYGHPDASRIIVIMGSGAGAVHETVDYLNDHGEKVGMVTVRLFRTIFSERFRECNSFHRKIHCSS